MLITAFLESGCKGTDFQREKRTGTTNFQCVYIFLTFYFTITAIQYTSY